MTPEPIEVRTKSGRTDADHYYQSVKRRLGRGEDVPHDEVRDAGYAMLVALIEESEEPK